MTKELKAVIQENIKGVSSREKFIKLKKFLTDLSKKIIINKKYIRYNTNELVSIREDLCYFIDLLEKIKYFYLRLDVSTNENTVLENCLNFVNKFINNLMNYCKRNKYLIPDDKMTFSIRLIGQNKCTSDILFLLHGLFVKNEIILKKVFKNPLEETIKLLKVFKKRIEYLEEIFPKKELNNIKIKIRKNIKDY